MTEHLFKMAGNRGKKLYFNPLVSSGDIKDGVWLNNGDTGIWVVDYGDLLKMVQLAKEARGSAKPEGWELDLLNKIADKLGLPAGADLEGILDLL